MVAWRHPEIQVEVITTVAGNVSVEQATRNALYIAELCGADVPIYRGMRRPIVEVCFDPDAAKYKQMLFDVLT
jgi:purine nucleosidase